LEIPATPLNFTKDNFQPDQVVPAVRAAVDAWKPDLVFQCFGFFMKPWVTEALAHYPQISRYYAYELMCPRDYRLYKDYHTCPNNYLETPKECLKCTLEQVWRPLRTGHAAGYAAEFEAARAYTPEYYRLVKKTLGMYRGIIVYNHFTRDFLTPYNPNVHVIGGGVHLQDFQFAPMLPRENGEKKIILMTGRADDYSKGMHTLRAAGEVLAQERNDFEIWVTHPRKNLETEWFKPIGWHSHDEIMQFYRESDICVVPSEWEEPFGLVAVEAMAIGRPVVVADVGGLQEIVVHGETGFIYRRGHVMQLVAHLRALLDDPALAARLGAAGRARVEAQYDWDTVIRRHYPAILEEALR
jgi:glycosyltransferase involved in cell wall biosynthesis